MALFMSLLAYFETYVAVIKTGSFTDAAKLLKMSKPVVSKQISALEKRLGVQLLHRTTRQLQLTEAGKTFAQYAQNIVDIAIEAEQSVQTVQNELKGSLRIAASESLAMTVLPKLLTDFQKAHPKLQIDIMISGDFVDLLSEGIDIALRMGTMDDSSLIARRLLTCHFHVFAAPNYWKNNEIPIHPTDLKSHNCLIYSQGPQPDRWKFKDENGDNLSLKVQGNLRSGHGQLLLDATLNGQGVMMAPTYLVNDAFNQGMLVPVLEDYKLQAVGLYALYPYTKFVPKKTTTFVSFLLDRLS